MRMRSEDFQIPTGSKFAALSSTLVVESETSVSSPPMIPARAALGVGDQEVGGIEPAQLAVERADLLARPRPPDDDSSLAQRREIEGVEGISEPEHDVVGHVDHVRDRTHPRGGEARAQPGWRRPDPDVAKQSAHVARAAVEVLDPDVDRLVADLLGILARRRSEVDAQERGHVTGEAVDGEQVGTVVRDL